MKRTDAHRFEDRLPFLDTWDTVAYVRRLHMPLRDFYPDAARYVGKIDTIDDAWGVERFEQAVGKPLQDKKAAVFTFFHVVGKQGNLRYVPQDPILLDQRQKDPKVGHLVFLTLVTTGYRGQIGMAMHPAGRITRLSVHPESRRSASVNRTLARLNGLGRKGQTEPFRVQGSRALRQIARDVFPLSMRAMETVTMYDREERERTLADE